MAREGPKGPSEGVRRGRRRRVPAAAGRPDPGAGAPRDGWVAWVGWVGWVGWDCQSSLRRHDGSTCDWWSQVEPGFELRRAWGAPRSHRVPSRSDVAMTASPIEDRNEPVEPRPLGQAPLRTAVPRFARARRRAEHPHTGPDVDTAAGTGPPWAPAVWPRSCRPRCPRVQGSPFRVVMPTRTGRRRPDLHVPGQGRELGGRVDRRLPRVHLADDVPVDHQRDRQRRPHC